MLRRNNFDVGFKNLIGFALTFAIFVAKRTDMKGAHFYGSAYGPGDYLKNTLIHPYIICWGLASPLEELFGTKKFWVKVASLTYFGSYVVMPKEFWQYYIKKMLISLKF